MSHLGHRLSALIDGELDDAERDRVLVHLARCDSCRAEAVALRTLKRRMHALGEAAADAALMRRLIGLGRPDAAGQGNSTVPDEQAGPWPRRATPSPFAPANGHREFRPSWYVTLGATAVVVVGVGTAAFLAGGDAGSQPGPRVTPAVDTYMLQHDLMTGAVPAATTPPLPHPSQGFPSAQP
jgi:anti-sigma factor RsiW